MACINEETRDFWQQLANDLSKQRPYPSRLVKVTGGRKHKGKEGVVVRHQYDKFSNAFRYGGDANLQMREMAGRAGFVCLVDAGSERFWVKADYVECVDDKA
jgi:hypothetical protein